MAGPGGRAGADQLRPLFLTKLTDLLGLPHAEPASAAHEDNDYVFERVVHETGRDGSTSSKCIAFHKKDCFVLDAVSDPKPIFPSDERDQTPAVLHQQIEAEGAVDAVFKQGRKALPAVSAMLASPHRLGPVSTADDRTRAA